MSIPDVAATIAAKYDLSRPEAMAMVRCVLDTVVEKAMGADGLSLHGFGTFKIVSRRARKGRNPRTGEAVAVPASRKLSFRQAKSIKERLNVRTRGKSKTDKAKTAAATPVATGRRKGTTRSSQ